MATQKYDVVILGSGNAGMGVTVETHKAGLSVAMVEHREIGGTCPNRGCTPKKVLVAAEQALDAIERAPAHHIAVGKPQLDWAALIAREKNMIAPLPDSFAKLMRERSVELLQGRAVFAGPNAVGVGGRTIEAKHIVIAVGSKPRKLPIDGAEYMITSDDVLSDRAQPREVVFVGGGVIALEFAQLYARAGSNVTVLESAPQFLMAFDQDAVAQVVRESERIGVTLHAGVKVKTIAARGGRFAVTFEQDGASRTITADRVVNGAGRIPDIDELDLAAGNVRLSDGRIACDEYLRSASNPAVYVCGDAASGPLQLSPVATYEGNIVGRNIVKGPVAKPDYGCIPSCVFTVPALATVGMTEQEARKEARKEGRTIKVHSKDMRDLMSARSYNEHAAWAKVIEEEGSGRILGAHLVGHSGEELIHLFAFAIKFGITAADLRDTVYAFPTFASDVKNMV